MNSVIKTNLENLHQTNFNLVRSLSFQQLIEKFIIYKSKTKFINLDGSFHFGLKGDDLTKIIKAKTNKDLEVAYNEIKSMNFDYDEIKMNLKEDLNSALSQGQEHLKIKNAVGSCHQAIFLVHDFEPYAYLIAYGKGDLPILDKPERYNFKLDEELYAGIGINYQRIWKYMIVFENLAEDLELDDFIFGSKFYDNLKKSIIFKT